MRTLWLWCVWCAVGCTGSAKQDETAAPGPGTDGSDGGAAQELGPGVNERTLEQVVEGETVERSYLLHLPSDYDGSRSTPLLFAFHGNGGQGADFPQR